MLRHKGEEVSCDSSETHDWLCPTALGVMSLSVLLTVQWGRGQVTVWARYPTAVMSGQSGACARTLTKAINVAKFQRRRVSIREKQLPRCSRWPWLLCLTVISNNKLNNLQYTLPNPHCLCSLGDFRKKIFVPQDNELHCSHVCCKINMMALAAFKYLAVTARTPLFLMTPRLWSELQSVFVVSEQLAG